MSPGTIASLHPTRSLPGARSAVGAWAGRRWRRALPIALALLATSVSRAHAVHDDEGPGPLPWRLSGKLRFTVDAAAFPDSGGNQLEVYIRIPAGTLRAMELADSAGARVRLITQLKSRYGGRAHEASQEFTLAFGDTGGTLGKVLLFRFPVKPGTYRLAVQLQDMVAHKHGLAYIGRDVSESRKVEGELSVPALQAGREISDLEFAWDDAAHDSTSAFEMRGRSVIPNPDRLYGLLSQRLRLAFVAVAPGGEGREWHWRIRVRDVTGDSLLSGTGDGPPGVRLDQTIVLDLSTVPAGAYVAEVQAWQEGDAGSLVQHRSFEVAWQPPSWFRDPTDIESEVHLILSGEEEDRFAELGPGAREGYLDRFWRDRDPTPDTAVNEVRDTYQRRIDYANRTFSHTPLMPGMFTDMGRVFIRYGEPDEVLKQVIPAGDQDLSRVIASLNDIQSRPTGDVDAASHGADQRPWEIWMYQEGVPRRPLTAPRDAVINQRARHKLYFLFVDDQGFGDFRQRFTNE